MIVLLVFCALLCGSCCNAQPWHAAPAATRIGAYGNAAPEAFYFVTNQAALATAKKAAVGLYSERRFLLAELSMHQLAFVQPAFGGGAGMQLAFAGNGDFNTSKAALAYGKNLGKKAALGVQFNYVNTHVRGYGNAAQAGVELGALLHLSNEWHAGFQFCYSTQTTGHDKGNRYPALYTAGLEYHPSETVVLTTELIKTALLPTYVQTSMQYRFAQNIWAKAGFNTGTPAAFVAGGYRLNDFAIEVIGSVHGQLGLTPALLLTYRGMGK